MRRQFRWDLVMMALVTMCVVCPPATAAGPYLFDMVKKPAYARALKTLLDHAGKLPDWTGQILKPKGAYVGGELAYTSIGGTSYEIFSTCEQQNCDRSQLDVMFAPDGAQAWGALFQEGTISYLGAPGKAQQTALKARLDARYDYDLSDVLKKPAYAQALKNLFDHAGNLPNWTQEVLKPQGYIVEKPVARANADRTTYEIFTECMPHDICEGTALVLMFAPDGTQAWGALFQDGAISYLGAPSEAQQAALKEKWRRGDYVTRLSYVIKKPAYARALKSLFDHTANLPSWTQEALKPNGYTVDKPVTYVGLYTTSTYEVYRVCMPYHCYESELALLFARNGAQAWGALVNRWPLSYLYLGAPTEAQQAALKEALGTNPSNPEN